MSLYSYNLGEPKPLPFRYKLDDGTFLFPLNSLSKDELEELGFIGPIEVPDIDENMQKLEWIDGKYEIIELTELEIMEKNAEKIRIRFANINYTLFWEKLSMSKLYKKLRNLSANSIQANALCTEIIVSLSEAKLGSPNTSQIQNYINLMFFVFDFSEDEIEEFKNIMEETNLSVQYNIPNEIFFMENQYDESTNTIVRKSPFKSWILIDGDWKSPIPYPNDGKIYNWDEEELNWIEIN
jgi:hypothetical protein